MAVFPGRRTRGQIISQALKKAGNVKIVNEARVELNRILERLYLEHEWPWLYTETTVTLTSSVTLPTDFLKVEQSDTGLRVTAIDGQTEDHSVLLVGPTDWRRRAIPRDEQAEFPEMAMIDFATSTLKPWPVPIGNVVALLVYKRLPAEVDPTDPVAYDTDVPVFPYHAYLTDAVEQWASEYEHDTNRASLLFQKNKDSLAMLLATSIPKEANQASTLELDPALFRKPLAANEE